MVLGPARRGSGRVVWGLAGLTLQVSRYRTVNDKLGFRVLGAQPRVSS